MIKTASRTALCSSSSKIIIYKCDFENQCQQISAFVTTFQIFLNKCAKLNVFFLCMKRQLFHIEKDI